MQSRASIHVHYLTVALLFKAVIFLSELNLVRFLKKPEF